MEKSIAQIWHEYFVKWPAGFGRKGVVVIGGEPMPFCDFVLNDEMIVLERATPDTNGARRVAVPFALLQAVKYVEPLRTEQFIEAGFRGKTVDKPQRAEQPPTSARPDAAAPQAPQPSVSLKA